MKTDTHHQRQARAEMEKPLLSARIAASIRLAEAKDPHERAAAKAAELRAQEALRAAGFQP